MSAESDLYAALAADGDVTGYVATRIYPDARPQESALPAIVYQRSATEPILSLHATHFGDLVSIEVSCVADSRDEAELIAAAVAAALVGSDFIYTDRASTYDDETDVNVTSLNFNRYVV